MKMWIDGAWTDGNARHVIEIVNPANKEVLDTVPAGTPEDVERAVAAAQAAFPAWRETLAVERANLLTPVRSSPTFAPGRINFGDSIL